jgi:ribosomal protein L24E
MGTGQDVSKEVCGSIATISIERKIPEENEGLVVHVHRITFRWSASRCRIDFILQKYFRLNKKGTNPKNVRWIVAYAGYNNNETSEGLRNMIEEC